jgi:hypothetical protein
MDGGDAVRGLSRSIGQRYDARIVCLGLRQGDFTSILVDLTMLKRELLLEALACLDGEDDHRLQVTRGRRDEALLFLLRQIPRARRGARADRKSRSRTGLAVIQSHDFASSKMDDRQAMSRRTVAPATPILRRSEIKDAGLVLVISSRQSPLNLGVSALRLTRYRSADRGLSVGRCS